MQDKIKQALISLIKESKRIVAVNDLKDWNFESAIEVAESVMKKSIVDNVNNQ